MWHRFFGAQSSVVVSELGCDGFLLNSIIGVALKCDQLDTLLLDGSLYVVRLRT